MLSLMGFVLFFFFFNSVMLYYCCYYYLLLVFFVVVTGSVTFVNVLSVVVAFFISNFP